MPESIVGVASVARTGGCPTLCRAAQLDDEERASSRMLRRRDTAPRAQGRPAASLVRHRHVPGRWRCTASTSNPLAHARWDAGRLCGEGRIGATLGDTLTQSHAEGGLAMGRIVASLALALGMVLLVWMTPLRERAAVRSR